jgi:hypothetical protein
LFVGADRGIYRSDDLGTTWAKWVVAGLPNVGVNDLQGETVNGQLLLAAATRARAGLPVGTEHRLGPLDLPGQARGGSGRLVPPPA